MDNDGSRVEYTEFGEILVRAAAEIKGIGITNGYRASVSIEGRREGGLAWFTAFSHPHMNPLLLCASQEPNGRLALIYIMICCCLMIGSVRESMSKSSCPMVLSSDKV